PPVSFLLPISFSSSRPAASSISTLSLHDALPILRAPVGLVVPYGIKCLVFTGFHEGFRFQLAVEKDILHQGIDRDIPIEQGVGVDRKSTRLNSSHVKISYAVFCLKKKKKEKNTAK